MSNRDLRVKYGRGAERVDKTNRESENKVMDSWSKRYTTHGHVGCQKSRHCNWWPRDQSRRAR